MNYAAVQTHTLKFDLPQLSLAKSLEQCLVFYHFISSQKWPALEKKCSRSRQDCNVAVLQMVLVVSRSANPMAQSNRSRMVNKYNLI